MSLSVLLSEYAMLLLWFISCVGSITSLYLSSKFVKKVDFEKSEKERNKHKETSNARINEMEFKLEMLPDKDTVHQLLVQIEKLTGKLDVYEERMDGSDNVNKRMQKQLDMMDNYLREAERRKKND